jgi:FkbM family methyltransferase
MSLTTLPRRTFQHASQWRQAAAMRRALPVMRRDDLVEVGDLGYGGYEVPSSLLDAESTCILAGVGEDLTFDLGIVARFGCRVHALDPVPRAAAFAAEAAAHEPRLVFHPVALWSRDETLTFHAPRESGYVSQSATNLHGTATDFRAQARSVRSLMTELGAAQVDLLKVSAEGSEYEIVEHVVADRVPVRVLCIEYAQPAPLEKVLGSCRRLEAGGFRPVASSIRLWNWKLTWVGAGAAGH